MSTCIYVCVCGGGVVVGVGMGGWVYACVRCGRGMEEVFLCVGVSVCGGCRCGGGGLEWCKCSCNIVWLYMYFP